MSKGIDKQDLYNELKSAIESDKLYWIRNDAKIKACYTSKNYDEFREIVSAAHLKPLDKKDKFENGKNSWNSHAKKTHY